MHVAFKLSNDQMTVSHVYPSKHLYSGRDPFMSVSLSKK